MKQPDVQVKSAVDGLPELRQYDFAKWTFTIGDFPLTFRQYTLFTFANWRISTELSPAYSVCFRRLANVQ